LGSWHWVLTRPSEMVAVFFTDGNFCSFCDGADKQRSFSAYIQ